MDLEILKDYFEAIEKELNMGGVEKLQLYKAMLKHKYILDAEMAKNLKDYTDRDYWPLA